MPSSCRQKQQCCSATGVICYSSASWLVQGAKREPERIYYLLSQIQFPPLVSLLFGLWHYRSFSQNHVFFALVTKKTEVRERKLHSLSFHRMGAKTCKMGDEPKQTHFVEETETWIWNSREPKGPISYLVSLQEVDKGLKKQETCLSVQG